MGLLDNNILENTDAKNLGFPNKNNFVIYSNGFLDRCSVYNWRNEYIFANVPVLNDKDYIKVLGVKVGVYNASIHDKALERKHGTVYRIKIGYIYKCKVTYRKTLKDEFYESYKNLFNFDELYDDENIALKYAYDVLLRIKQDPEILNKTYYIQNYNNQSINEHSFSVIAHLKKFMGNRYEPIR